MLNKENYANEILDIAIRGENFGVHKFTREINRCKEFDCTNCLFHRDQSKGILCSQRKTEWANSEYKEKTELTNEEREYLLNIIKPFKNFVIGIMKRHPLDYKNVDNISIKFRDIYTTWDTIREITLPTFETGEKFNGIDYFKSYTLSELGL